MPKESSQRRKWEKERRDRLNEAFDGLAKVLPSYEPSTAICKIDILQKAASNIQELQEKIDSLVSSNPEKKSETESLILKKLQDRVKKLLLRNEQLTNLLRDAGITVPSACGTIKKFKKRQPWSKKITPEQAKVLQEKEKENMLSKSVPNKNKKAKAVKTPPTLSTVIVNGVEQKVKASNRRRKKKKLPLYNYFIVFTQLPTMRDIRPQLFFLIPNQPSSSFKNPIKSGMISKPMIVTPKSRTLKQSVLNSSLMSRGGTLILADGKVMSVLPQVSTVLPTSSNLVITPAISTLPQIVKTQGNNGGQKGSSIIVDKLPSIQPKYCLTRTTQVNKVPIPALTSRYANNNDLLNSKKENVKIKELVKTLDEPAQKSNKTETEVSKKKPDKRKNDGDDEINCKKSKIESTSVNDTNKVSNDIRNPPVTEAEVSKINDTDVVELNTEILVEKPVEEKKEMTKAEESTEKEKMQVENKAIQSPVDEVPVFAKDCDTATTTIENIVTTTTVTATTTANDDMKHLDLNLPHSELSNDIFASLQVPSGCQNPESTSPTAAFLLAFPLVSSGVKVTEVIDEENSESQRGTPNLLQIGTMESTKPAQSQSDVITSNFLDNFSFFSKDICGSFYNNYSNMVSKTVTSTVVETSAKTANGSIYVNVKSPCLPTSTVESVKPTYNMLETKPSNDSKEIPKSCDNSIVTNQKANDNFASQNPTNFKPNANCVNSKQKIFDQKLQYYPTTTYSHTNSSCNYTPKNDTSKTSYANINRNYANPLYTNSNNYSYNYHPDSNFNENYYKNISRNDTKAYYPLNYDNYTDYRKSEQALPSRYYEGPTYVKDKKNNNPSKAKPSQNKQPINWMTTPDNRLQTSECLLNSFSKGDFSQSYPFNSYVTTTSTYFPAATIDTSGANCAMEAKKSLDLPIASLNSAEEKQFSWSPTKLPHFLDPPHNFVSSTLPTLVGDLALGNPLPFTEQKTQVKDVRRSTKVNSYENQTNFLSVSQLVDHNKPESVPAKTATRRNSGNRSKSSTQKVKRGVKLDNKDIMRTCAANDKVRPVNNYNILPAADIFPEQNSHKNRNTYKNVSSSYSAEALIGPQVPPPVSKSLGASSFLAENIISYFPSVDIPQDNYMAQNQNYQANFTHNLTTSLQNNTYSTNSFIYTASTIAPSYLSTSNFETPPHDYLQDNLNLIPGASTKDNKNFASKPFAHRQPSKEDKGNNHHAACANNLKRQRRKPETTNTLGNFDLPFLSMPGSNNSPILPDDFHSHTTFLPPATPFSCKNSLYSKQTNDMSAGSLLPIPPVTRSSIQHPEISPSMNSVGTSLTNFNLSTIFPEINKGQITEMYQTPGVKEQPHSKNYPTAPPQVPLNSEPKFNFSM